MTRRARAAVWLTVVAAGMGAAALAWWLLRPPPPKPTAGAWTAVVTTLAGAVGRLLEPGEELLDAAVVIGQQRDGIAVPPGR